MKLPDNHAHSLEELNTKLTHWIQTVYHLRPHSSTGVSPQFRFAHAAGALRYLDAGLELEPLELIHSPLASHVRYRVGGVN